MTMKVRILRNLRKSIKQGHPWVYAEAIEPLKSKVDVAQFCQVLDNKGELGWAIYDPHSPLALRMLSTAQAAPNKNYFQALFRRAYTVRQSLRSSSTTAYRLFNGEGDLLPGLVCDVYDKIAVLQFDGQGPSEFWNKQMIADWILGNTHCTTVVEKLRRNASEKGLTLIAGEALAANILEKYTIKENNVLFDVQLEKGQKTGFFLDQRDNRHFVLSRSQNKTVLNLFSYTGGFSVYSGCGGAQHVTSVDISKGAIDCANENWVLNGLNPTQHLGIANDVFDFLKNSNQKWDHVIVDPPSMTHSEEQKKSAQLKYIDVFSQAAQKVKPGGEFSVSSCSSHIDFDAFFEILSESLSISRRKGQILRVSGQGLDHPFPHSCHELRYLKFVHVLLD